MILGMNVKKNLRTCRMQIINSVQGLRIVQLSSLNIYSKLGIYLHIVLKPNTNTSDKLDTS